MTKIRWRLLVSFQGRVTKVKTILNYVLRMLRTREKNKPSCPTFSLCLAMMDSIFFFSSSMRRRRCSSFSRTLFSWEAIASTE